MYTKEALLAPTSYSSFVSRLPHWQRLDESSRRALQTEWEFRQAVLSSKDKLRQAEAAGVEVWLCELERSRVEAELDRWRRSLQQLVDT